MTRRRPFSLGITGGICSGKTLFSGFLKEFFDAEYFNADDCVKKHLETDAETAAEISRAFGPDILDASGRPRRDALRDIVFQDDSKRKLLESILHPKVWSACEESRLCAEKNRRSFLLADIPLIYETRSQARFDAVALVACSRETQLRRLAEERGIRAEQASRILESQLPLERKIPLADHVFWNDGLPDALRDQARIFADNLQND